MFSMEVTRLIERCRQGDADALEELSRVVQCVLLHCFICKNQNE